MKKSNISQVFKFPEFDLDVLNNVYTWIDELSKQRSYIEIEIGGETYFYITIHDSQITSSLNQFHHQFYLKTRQDCKQVEKMLKELFEDYLVFPF